MWSQVQEVTLSSGLRMYHQPRGRLGKNKSEEDGWRRLEARSDVEARVGCLKKRDNM